MEKLAVLIGISHNGAGVLSEQPFDFTTQYHRHREPVYVMVNHRNTLPKVGLDYSDRIGSMLEKILNHNYL